MPLHMDIVGKTHLEHFQEEEIEKISEKDLTDNRQKCDMIINNNNHSIYVNNSIISPKIIYNYRREREDIFGNSGIFSDPCWDMLLTLFSYHLNEKRECISSVCISSHVPVTTALRWLKVLEKQNLVIRTNDPRDSRRKFVALTAAGVSKMYAALNVNLFDKSNK